MAVIARYQPEGDAHTYPTLQQAQLVEVLNGVEGLFLEQYRIEIIVEAIDKFFIITTRPVEEIEKDETL